MTYIVYIRKIGWEIKKLEENNHYVKTSSSKAAISMIMEKPENGILLLQDILPSIYCYCFISE